jgi:hypothetical protein
LAGTPVPVGGPLAPTEGALGVVVLGRCAAMPGPVAADLVGGLVGGFVGAGPRDGGLFPGFEGVGTRDISIPRLLRLVKFQISNLKFQI